MTNEKTLFRQFCPWIGQPVRVQLQIGRATDGVLYCIDPETEDVALLVPSGQNNSEYSVKIVLAHDIRGVEKEPLCGFTSVGLPTLASLTKELAKGKECDRGEDAAVIHQRREELCQFLTNKFVPFEVVEDGSVRVFGGAATLREPFRLVECGNEQLLRQLHKLLDEFGQLHE
uniref:Gem-associated protein 6 n=1 Tax=Peronospora matthiolae TaxID=2874970 RepID=A0AAV1U9J4_9STRA